MLNRLRIYLNRLRERLWVRPLGMSVISVAAVFLVKTLDTEVLGQLVPDITQVSIDPAFETLGRALDEENAADGFDAAHSLKGILANTGLTPLYNTIVRIVEPLRAGKVNGLKQD